MFSKLFGDWQFYLAGGTAISIYFGHRLSVDLDWFTPTSIPEPLILAQNLRSANIPFQTAAHERGTLHGSIFDVLVSFFEYPYALLQPLTYWERGNCYLASLSDVACMKLVAIAQRGSRKDFIDLYAIVQNGQALPELLALYQKKYQVDNVAPVLMGLAYFDDAEQEPDPLNWAGDWQEVKASISRWVREI